MIDIVQTETDSPVRLRSRTRCLELIQLFI